MATPTAEVGSFPSPYSIEPPPGCEGWEEMYPYYTLFDERRRDLDENRFWFWNSMHFPLPMPAFDVHAIDSPYQAVGAWQNRVFAVPPAMGIDYRVINGYVYISGNPVTDPDKIAERAEFFQRALQRLRILAQLGQQRRFARRGQRIAQRESRRFHRRIRRAADQRQAPPRAGRCRQRGLRRKDRVRSEASIEQRDDRAAIAPGLVGAQHRCALRFQ